MPDISMCNGYNCPRKNECFRHRATPHERQSWIGAPVKPDGTCDHFMEIRNPDMPNDKRTCPLREPT